MAARGGGESREFFELGGVGKMVVGGMEDSKREIRKESTSKSNMRVKMAESV